MNFEVPDFASGSPDKSKDEKLEGAILAREKEVFDFLEGHVRNFMGGLEKEFPDLIDGLNLDIYDKNSAIIFYKNDQTSRMVFCRHVSHVDPFSLIVASVSACDSSVGKHENLGDESS